MARKDKIYIPSGIGGLVRYPEEEKEVLRLKPRHLIILISLIAIFELLLKFLF
jgi:preprotein translocase subunit Sec61beta